MRSTSVWGVKSLDPWVQVHIFLELKTLTNTNPTSRSLGQLPSLSTPCRCQGQPVCLGSQQQQTPSSLRISSASALAASAWSEQAAWSGTGSGTGISRQDPQQMANGRKVGPLEASFQRVQELDIEARHHCYVWLQSDEDGRFAWCFPALNFSSETISRQDFLNAANNCLELASLCVLHRR